MRFPKLKVVRRLVKKLGFRYTLDVIAVEPQLVKGSHGISNGSPETTPILMSIQPELLPQDRLDATEVCGLILKHLFDWRQESRGLSVFLVL